MDYFPGLPTLRKYKDALGYIVGNEVKYEQVEQIEEEQAHSELHICSHCKNAAHKATSRRKIAACLLITLVVTVVWPALITLYVGRNTHHHDERKLLIDQFPMVPTDFQEDMRFVVDDPSGSPFWRATDFYNTEIDFLYHNKSDSISANAWNYYGNTYIRLHKDSPFSIPGGMELVPLFPEKDAWLKDYTGFITAYQHSLHFLGVVKTVLNSLIEGRPPAFHAASHARDHCIEVIRHSLMCNPDLQISADFYDEKGVEHRGPFWGGQKHQCRDQKLVYEFLASRNMGFKVIDGELQENGRPMTKVWDWPLQTDSAAGPKETSAGASY